MSPRKKGDLTFEQAFEQLEEIVEKMETGEYTLHQSMDAFEQGMKHFNFCKDQLQAAEVKLKKLSPKAETDQEDE